jgi:hemerythrin-like domain-containing protein
MHEATTILRQEHDAILRMLDVTEESAHQLLAGKDVPGDVLSGLLEFLRFFADRCHHGKEEELLFPLMEQKGIPRDGGPIGVMLHEHEQGRALIHAMNEAAAAYRLGEKAAGPNWARPALAYVALLREHIFKENNILFMMAERMLSPEEQVQLAEAFERVEKEKIGEGTHERLHALMDQLSAAVTAR